MIGLCFPCQDSWMTLQPHSSPACLAWMHIAYRIANMGTCCQRVLPHVMQTRPGQLLVQLVLVYSSTHCCGSIMAAFKVSLACGDCAATGGQLNGPCWCCLSPGVLNLWHLDFFLHAACDASFRPCSSVCLLAQPVCSCMHVLFFVV